MQNAQSIKNSLAWFIWGLSALFFFYEFLLQIAPSVMATELRQDFAINATHFGRLTTFYFVAYAAMQIPGGLLLDRYGPRLLLTAATAFCAVGTLVFSNVTNFNLVELARFITGLGSAFAMLGTLVLVANWFPINRFALLHGLTLTIGMLGAVFGGLPMAKMTSWIGWRDGMLVLGITGIILTILIWVIIRDHPEFKKTKRHHEISTKQVFSALAGIVKHPQSWITALYGVLMYAPTTALGWWGPSFIHARYDLDTATAAFFISLMFIGWAIGSPLFGALSDYVGRRKVPLYISSIGTLISILIIVHFQNLPVFALATLIFLFGFFTCGFVPAFSIVRELHPKEVSGTALGFMNMINSLGGAIAPPVIGIILDLYWNGTLVDNIRTYSAHDYKIAFTTLPILLGLALIVLFFIKETHCQTAASIHQHKSIAEQD